jgi:hypothetical protein
MNGQDSIRRGLNLNLRLIYIIASPVCPSAIRGGFACVKRNVRTETKNYQLRTLEYAAHAVPCKADHYSANYCRSFVKFREAASNRFAALPER